jgi:enoyl-CoA hydratase
MAVRIEKKGRVWTVIHSRPEARNAMNPESADALVAAFEEFDRDPEAAVAVLWGEGGAFCAGWDLKYCASLIKNPEELHSIDYPLEDRKAIPRGPLGPTRLELDKPVIAAVAGPAVAGGFELALWCDLRVMAADAVMGVFCRRFGVPLIDGGTVRLARLIGQSRAMDLLLTGRAVDAQEALAIGLANRLAPAGGALPMALDLADEIGALPQVCLRNDRLSLLEQWGTTEDEAMRREFERGMRTLASGESVAGASRFARGAGRHGTA